MDVSGYGTRANSLGPQPFNPDDVVLLQDGSCGSTCAVFSELMKTQGKVKQVVIGGTPRIGPMQGVGGSKGAQVWDFARVYAEASAAYDFLNGEYQVALNETELGRLVFSHRPLQRSAYSEDGAPLSSINLRDNIRRGDRSNTPLEFVH